MSVYDAPAWRVTLDGRDLTGTIAPRLISMTITECRTEELDQLDIELSDHDGLLAIPSKDAELTVSVGWRGAGMVDKGKFKVDEIEHRGTPDVLTLRARSADLLAAMRVRMERSYHDTTVADIINQIAALHGLQARIGSAGSEPIAHIDQTESDLAFLNRLGTKFDQIATVKSGYLLFMPAQDAKTFSGQDIPTITINRSDGDEHRYHVAGRDSYSGVRAYWHDPNHAKQRSVLVGISGNAKRLRDTFASEPDALAAAQAEWQRIQRGAATLEFTLARGAPQIGPQTPVKFVGIKAPISETDWIVQRVTHTLDVQGLHTRLELETRNAENDDKEVDDEDGNANEDEDSEIV